MFVSVCFCVWWYLCVGFCVCLRVCVLCVGLCASMCVSHFVGLESLIVCEVNSQTHTHAHTW